jgi:hypothetical protein
MKRYNQSPWKYEEKKIKLGMQFWLLELYAPEWTIILKNYMENIWFFYFLLIITMVGLPKK